jgi:putative restriction endonuclease
VSPRISQEHLLDQVRAALAAMGWQVGVHGNQRPFGLTIARAAKRFDLIVYVWAATHGGGDRSADEYRIQMTGVSPPLHRSRTAVTLLLGLSDEGILTAWDPAFHGTFSTGSPSLQTSRRSMRRAARAGFGFYRKSSGEVTVSFLPEHLGAYIEHQSILHALDNSTTVDVIQEAADQETEAEFDNAIDVPPDEALGTEEAVFETVRRAIRDATFTSRVLTAYKSACCMCGMQLGLVEAAHIVPLATARNFSTRNGLSLCRNHHRAYDNGLVGVRADFRIVVNQTALQAATRDGWGDGRALLIDCLFRSIRLPGSPLALPAANLLSHALTVRGFHA